MNVKIQTETEEKEFNLSQGSARKILSIAQRMELTDKESCIDHKPKMKFNPENGHKGFLIIRCQKCGKIKGFCAKNPVTDYRCSCGAETPLGDLRRAEVTCKCGGHYKYRTNIEDKVFDFSCLSCGSPVDLVWNDRKKVYESLM